MRLTSVAATAVLLVVSLSSCTTAALRLPDGFGADAVAYEVSGHSPRRFNEPVRFGPYSALEMREGSTFAWAVPLPGFELGQSRKAYAYTLVARDLPPVQVQCRNQAWAASGGRASRRASVDLTALSGPLLGCGLRLDDGPVQTLEVTRQGGQLQGRLLAPWGQAYRVRELRGYAGTPITSTTPTGYAIADGGTTLAVVDVLNGGRVHLARTLDDDQRVYFAASAAALLLLDPELGEG